MAQATYNFVGATSPAGVLAVKGFIGDSVGGLPTPPSGVEGTQENYDYIEAIDATRWPHTELVLNYYPFKIFRYYVPPEVALPWKITVTHVGLVPIGGPGSQGFTLHVYKVRPPGWVLLDTSGVALDADDTLSGTVNKAKRYLTTDRYIYTGVINTMWHTALLSQRSDNYTEIQVDWWAGIKRWGPGWGEGIEPPYGEV